MNLFHNITIPLSNTLFALCFLVSFADNRLAFKPSFSQSLFLCSFFFIVGKIGKCNIFLTLLVIIAQLMMCRIWQIRSTSKSREVALCQFLHKWAAVISFLSYDDLSWSPLSFVVTYIDMYTSDLYSSYGHRLPAKNRISREKKS